MSGVGWNETLSPSIDELPRWSKMLSLLHKCEDCVTFAHRTSAHHDFVTSAHQNWDICSPPSGHLLTKIWDICSPKSGHLLTKFLKFCNPIIKSESVPPGHVKDYILMGWCTRRLRRMSTRWWMRTMWSTRSWMKVHSWKIWWWWMYLYVSYWKQHTN